MKIQNQETLRWGVILGLAGFLAVGGCSTKSVTVGSSGGAAPSEEVVKPMEIAKAQPGEKPPATPRRELLDVYFAFDKWSLSPEGKKNLAQNVDVLKQHPENKLLIEGHCDERGSREYNLVLGEKRAQETRRYLQSLGIKNPITVTSFGKERPVCTEPDESCYWKNRRAHLVVQEGK
ncbi:MAG TPA: OmpA family protein [Nitrospirota bacterium]